MRTNSTMVGVLAILLPGEMTMPRMLSPADSLERASARVCPRCAVPRKVSWSVFAQAVPAVTDEYV